MYTVVASDAMLFVTVIENVEPIVIYFILTDEGGEVDIVSVPADITNPILIKTQIRNIFIINAIHLISKYQCFIISFRFLL
jgi:hypothetical protein